MDYETKEDATNVYYKPKNKKEREARRRIYDRYRAMRDDSIRKEEEEHWDKGDKAYQQWMPPRDEGDWRSHLVLPDAFAAIQSHAQETIDRRSRPVLESVESSDLAREQFCNDVMKYSMDRTGFDKEMFQAKLTAAIRGTAFVMERYRLDKRTVQDPDSIDENGELVYKKREIVDYDDTVTEFCENDTIFIDPSATHESKARDMIEREVLDIKEFKRIYGSKAGFMNVDKVRPCGDMTESTTFFQKAKDMSNDDVEILHYYNRSTDSYDACANNVLVRMSPIPYKHKELPVGVVRHYYMPGRMYGMGIPRVIFSLTEERASLRRMNMDRQHMQTDKVFLANDLVDLDEDDARVGPHRIISVNTNGMQLNQVIQPLEFGDVPMSYYRSEEMLLEDIRRAHGIDDRIQGVNVGGTATEAAILKETAQKRINMINVMAEMDTIIRIGRLKWANIQFFYPSARVKRITEDNTEREKKVYRTIKVQGKEYTITQENGGMSLDMSEIEGTSGFVLDPRMAYFMEGDYDVTMNADASVVLSKPLQQAKITEMFGLIALNPQLAATIDPDKAVRRYLTINDEDPKMWMRGRGLTEDQWKRLAIQENNVMATGIPLVPTDGASEAHTMEHLHFTDTPAFYALPQPVQDNIMQHILGEDAARGGTASQMMGDPNAQPPMGGQPGPDGGMGSNLPPEPTVADMQPSTPDGAEGQDARMDMMRG